MIRFVRKSILTVCAIIFGINSLFLNWIIFPILNATIVKKQKKIEISSFIVQKSWHIFIQLMMFLGVFDIKINSKEKLKNINNHVIVSSHPSYIDVLILIALIPRTTCFSADRFKTNFFMNNIVNSLFITKGDSIEDMQKNAQEILDMGFNLLIFPSGIRHKVNEHPKIRKGASFIASNTNKNILPIKLSTDTDFLQISNSICDAGEKKPHYDLIIKNEIDINEYLNNYSDKVTLKKELTKKISQELYS